MRHDFLKKRSETGGGADGDKGSSCKPARHAAES